MERAGGQAWEVLLARPDHPKAATELGNLSATMGDLANALRGTGEHDEALAVAEKALAIDERRGNQREVATGHGQCAIIDLLLGNLATAERHAHESREIRESLGLKEAWRDYHTLSEIATARSDTATAAE